MTTTTPPTTVGSPDDEPPRILRLIPGTGAVEQPDTDPDDAETTLVGPVIEGVPVDEDDRDQDVPVTASWSQVRP